MIRGSNLENVVLSYDIDTKYNQVKTDLENIGYLDHYSYVWQTKVYYLPNTTLWHQKRISN